MKKGYLLFLGAAVGIFVFACSQPVDPSPDAVEKAPGSTSTASLSETVSVADPDNPTTPIDSYSVELLAGRHIEVGEVSVAVYGDELRVTYTTVDGWELDETKLWVGDALSDIPQAGKSGNPRLGEFPYQHDNMGEASRHTVRVWLPDLVTDLADLCGTTLNVAAYAEVVRHSSTDRPQREGAWAAGERIVERGNWATYFAVVLTCLEPDFEYEVGDRGPAGGRIFYIDEENEFHWTYLELAPVSTEWHNKPWGGQGISVGPEAQGQAIGTGASNTAAIVAAFGDNEPYADRHDYAAKLCDDLVVRNDGTDYDDWFLPSRYELMEIWNHKTYNLTLMHYAYWSSSENELNAFERAWESLFISPIAHAQHPQYKSSDSKVRAIRAF